MMFAVTFFTILWLQIGVRAAEAVFDAKPTIWRKASDESYAVHKRLKSILDQAPLEGPHNRAVATVRICRPTENIEQNFPTRDSQYYVSNHVYYSDDEMIVHDSVAVAKKKLVEVTRGVLSRDQVEGEFKQTKRSVCESVAAFQIIIRGAANQQESIIVPLFDKVGRCQTKTRFFSSRSSNYGVEANKRLDRVRSQPKNVPAKYRQHDFSCLGSNNHSENNISMLYIRMAGGPYRVVCRLLTKLSLQY